MRRYRSNSAPRAASQNTGATSCSPSPRAGAPAAGGRQVQVLVGSDDATSPDITQSSLTRKALWHNASDSRTVAAW